MALRLLLMGGMLGIGLALQMAAAAPPPVDTVSTAPDAKPYPHVFLGRLTLGAGFPRSSPHSELLEADGYELGARYNLEAAAAGVIAERVAIGGYFAYGRSSDEPTNDAPKLEQEVTRLGGELLLVLQPTSGLLVLGGPQVGMLSGTLELYGRGSTQTVVEYGGMVGLWARTNSGPPVFYIGATLSYLLAPADPPGAIGRDYDYGALYFGLSGVFGG